VGVEEFVGETVKASNIEKGAVGLPSPHSCISLVGTYLHFIKCWVFQNVEAGSWIL